MDTCTLTPPPPPRPRRAVGPAAGRPRPSRRDRRAGLLTAEQEREIAGRIAAGDRESRNQMVRANLGLVVVIARRYAGHGLEMEDLVGEGVVGLITAAERFDPRFNARFSTYAGLWVKQAIRAALGNTGATIRLPIHAVNLLARWRRAEIGLGAALGREAGFDEVADAMGLPAGKRDLVRQALRTRHTVEPAEAPTDPAAPPAEPLAELERAERGEDLRRRLGRLDATERSVVVLRYGLGGGDPMTLIEVGARLGFTREWIRKVELRALRKLA